jgi:hypothetical protein
MTTRRTAAALVAGAAMAVAFAMPVTAGVACSLQATVGGGSATEVPVGEEVLIEGFGFPAGDVEVSYSVDGTALTTETVTAEADGTFETTVTPQAGEEGLWSVEATDVEDICTATTGFLVVGATPTATPTPTPAPTSTATPAPTAAELPDVAMDVPTRTVAPWVLLVGGIGLAGLVAFMALRRPACRRG